MYQFQLGGKAGSLVATRVDVKLRPRLSSQEVVQRATHRKMRIERDKIMKVLREPRDPDNPTPDRPKKRGGDS